MASNGSILVRTAAVLQAAPPKGECVIQAFIAANVATKRSMKRIAKALSGMCISIPDAQYVGAERLAVAFSGGKTPTTADSLSVSLETVEAVYLYSDTAHVRTISGAVYYITFPKPPKEPNAETPDAAALRRYFFNLLTFRLDGTYPDGATNA